MSETMTSVTTLLVESVSKDVNMNSIAKERSV